MGGGGGWRVVVVGGGWGWVEVVGGGWKWWVVGGGGFMPRETQLQGLVKVSVKFTATYKLRFLLFTERSCLDRPVCSGRPCGGPSRDIK